MHIDANRLVNESVKNRSKLPDEVFGLPELRKYPMPDVKHVNLAIQMFSRCDEEHRKELAKNIKKRIEELNCWKDIKVTKNNIFWDYCKHPLGDYLKMESAVQEAGTYVPGNVKKSTIHPIFIVSSYTNTAFGKIVRGVTGDSYTHACMAFESNLKTMYTFNKNSKYAENGGLSIESLKDYIDTYEDAQIHVSTFFVNDRDLQILNRKIDYYLLHYKQTTYATYNLLNIAANRQIETKNDLNMVCSQFVDSMIKLLNVDATMKTSNLVRPQDLVKTSSPKIYTIYDGLAKEYKPYEIDRKINFMINRNKVQLIRESVVDLFPEVLAETVEFPVQFDEEGNLLIKKKEKIDFLSEYNKCKKLRPEYIKNDNLEGLKYELAKLWYMNCILEKLIAESPDDNKLKETRSKVLTEFSLYLTAITKVDNKFNFSSYYETTPFSKDKIKINKSTIKYGTALFKQMLK